MKRRREGWINIYWSDKCGKEITTGTIYDSQEEAENNAYRTIMKYLETVKIKL